MQNTQHTKTPEFHLSADNSEQTEHDGHRRQVAISSGDVSLIVSFDGPSPDYHPNDAANMVHERAAFIVRACNGFNDLVEELEQQKKRWRVIYDHSDDNATRAVANAAIHQISAALAKAGAA